ncbi:hypothetical protein, partial [Falsiroseomonas sp.]|uniref:hypothetical protein n=2 Tax=Falsiroseomonas sp. TaxID=2870721 RepID=UPI0027359FC6
RPPPAPPAAARPPPPLHEVAAGWSFSTASNTCTARITHPDAALSVTAGPEARVDFVARGTDAAPRILSLAFRGPEGAWSRRLAARGAEGAGVTQPLSPATQRRVLALLGGGTLTFARPGAAALRVTLPDAGVSGRDWFGCLARLQPA